MKIKQLKIPFTFTTLLWLIAIPVIWVNLNHERWLSKKVIYHDVINYYDYLPALFLKGDLTLSFIDAPGALSPDELYWPNKTANGHHIIKMSMGMAVFYLPFFFIAHAFAHLLGYPTHGFSEPYQFAILFSSLVYYLLGLYYLRKFLLHFFTDQVILPALLLLTYGTNVFYYLTIGAGLAHINGFALFSAFLYVTHRWFAQPSNSHAASLGILVGLLTLVRPINALCVLLFVMYGVCAYSTSGLKQTPKRTLLFQVLIMLTLPVLLWLPQLFYWKLISGHYLFNSYVGERFYFNNPHVLNGLFSFRKGWLVYTPLMSFALAGLFVLKRLWWPVLVFFLIYIYVCFSWWCWWYGGSFGQRVMIDIYPVLALPFCALLVALFKKQKTLRLGVYTLMSGCVLLNLFQTMQAKYNIIHFDSMTRANYFEVFFTTTKKPDRENYLQHPDYEKALRGEDEY